MNLNRKVNSILGLLLIIITLLGLGIYLFFSYQSPSKLFRESASYIDYRKMTGNEKKNDKSTEVYSAEKACEESQSKLFKNSYLLKDKKHNKEILRLTADSNYNYFTEQASFYNQNSCENKDHIVGLNNIFRWKNFLIYSILEENYDCINDKLIAEGDGDNDCQSYFRKIISYDLDTGEEKTLWKKSEIEVPKKDKEGNPTGEMEKQSFSLMRNIELIGDHLYITVHPKNTCYACGYAGWGGFTFRINLNNPGEEELIGGLGYIGGKIEEHDGNYYIVNGACTEGGCFVGNIDLYDLEENEIDNIGKVEVNYNGEDNFGLPSSLSPIGFWNNKLLLSLNVYAQSSIYDNYNNFIRIYSFDLDTAKTNFFYESKYKGVELDGDNLILFDNPKGRDFYKRGTQFEVYNLLTDKIDAEFEMSQYSSFSYVYSEDRFDGNHSEALNKLEELGFDIEDKNILDKYELKMPSSSGDLFKFYFER